MGKVNPIKLGCKSEAIPAYAKIKMNDMIIETPNIISISVSKSRGSLAGTASATFTVEDFKSTGRGPASVSVVIHFWEFAVFTGYVKRMGVSPSYECPGKYIIRIQAEDAMSELEGKFYTRRQKLPGLGPLALITTVYKRVYTGFDNPAETHDISSSASPVKYLTHTVNMAEHTKLLKNGETNVMGDLHPVTKVADKPQRGGAGTGGGFILHDHTSLDLTSPHGGGPSMSVFSSK